MKITKTLLLPMVVLMLCGAGTRLFAPPATYDFFPINPDFSGSLLLDSSSDPSGTSADVLSWDIVDPSGEFTPGNSTLEAAGIVDWNPSTITDMDLIFDADATGLPVVTLTQSDIIKDVGDHTTDRGTWGVPETSNAAILLMMTTMALGAYHLCTRERRSA
jgi:hypothetical protein